MMIDSWQTYSTPSYPPSAHPHPVVVVAREADGQGEIGLADMLNGYVWWSGIQARKRGNTVINWQVIRAIEARYQEREQMA